MDEKSRRVPTYERGIRSMGQILDAAEVLFAERGVDAVSTRHIAQHAAISPASLYQYFSNKEEVLDAVLLRYGTALIAIYDSRMQHMDDAPQSVEQLAAQMVIPLLEYGWQHVGSTRLILHAQAYPSIGVRVAGIRAELVQMWSRLIQRSFPAMDSAQVTLSADVSLTITLALATRALEEKAAHNPTYAERLIEQASFAVTAYVNATCLVKS
jgi:AcrR family transcriptional regulator